MKCFTPANVEMGVDISMPVSFSEMSGFICIQRSLSLDIGNDTVSTRISTFVRAYSSFVMSLMIVA
ncbi:MAG TPA: hypothetical protein EYG73_07025 [Arcobacter sp.]|nr:hypothetical protein [Arcobacter sp.]